MQTISTPQTALSRSSSERGAALVTMLLVSMLLLAAGGALIMRTAMTATTAVDSTAEMQAFYVAEAGLQSALNVLRGNAAPVASSGLDAATARMSFRTAVIPNISNGTGNSGALRFAGWLPYNDRLNVNSLVPVTVGGVTRGYRLTIENLDPNSHIVTYDTVGTFNGGSDSYFDCGGGANTVRISYDPQPTTTLTPDLNVYPLTLDSNLGKFVITRVAGTGTVNVPPNTTFDLTVQQTAPWAATTTFEATLAGQVTNTSTDVQVTFKKVSMRADGTTYALNFSGGDPKVLALTYSSSPSTTSIPARVTSPDPKRLRIRSYGFGPKSSEKRLEMIITRANVDFEAVAGVTFQGADDCSPLNLDTGSSGAKNYSGIDRAGAEPQRPTFAVALCDVNDANSGIKKHDTVEDPEIGVLASDNSVPGTVERPSFLDSANKARTYLSGLEAKARSVGRYLKPASGGSITVSDDINSPAFTFVDGDCTLDDGAGFLVVTGTLTMRGNTNFNGVILVLGEGKVERNGGGNGDIFGGITVAKFARPGPGPFLAPTFNTNGGGNSTIQYDSLAIGRGLRSTSNVSGVREF